MKVQIITLAVTERLVYQNIEVDRIFTFIKSKGIDTVLTYMDINASNYDQDIDFACDIFYFLVDKPSIKSFFDISRSIKRVKNCYIFVGGRFATNCAEQILEENVNVDAVMLGFGEYPLFEAASKIKNNNLNLGKHVVTRQSSSNKIICSPDIRCLPYPDLSNVKKHKHNCFSVINIRTSHGCRGNCSFCTLNYKTSWSGNTPDEIINQLMYIHNNTSIRHFNFSDASIEDNSMENKDRLKELC